MPDVGCDYCGEEFGSELEQLRHVLDEHREEMSSHDTSKVKKEIRKLERQNDTGAEFPKKKMGIVLFVLVAVVSAGYAMYASDIITTGSQSTSSSTQHLGPLGSTHEHAQFTVVLDGQRINFAQPRYQLRSQYVHFEGGDGSTIHKHATGVTIGYSLDTLGMEFNGTCIEHDAQRYCEGDGSELVIRVNGNEIDDPANHVISDGESIRIVYDSS